MSSPTTVTTMHSWKAASEQSSDEPASTEREDGQKAFKKIAEYVRYYNFDRRHSVIDYRSPAQFEQIRNSRKVREWPVRETVTTSHIAMSELRVSLRQPD